MSYEEPESNNNLMNNPRLLTAIIVGAIGLVSIVGCVAIFFIFGSRNQPPTQGTKVIQVTKIPSSTVTLTSVPSATKQPTLDPNKASGGGGGETPTPDLTATFINRPQTRAATLSEMVGAVQIKSPIGGDFTTVTTNVTVPAGTIILTSENSSVKITLTEGTIIRVGSQTQVKIDQLGGTTQNPSTKLKLDFGKVWSIVGGSLGTGSFDVETPLGVASVIGSFMGTESNPTEELDIITCLEGKCRYSNSQGVQTLTTLQQLIVKKDTALGAPTKMDTVQVNDWSAEKVSEVVTLTPTPTATSTPTGTRTPTGTATASGTPNATSTFNAQNTGTAAAATGVAQTSTASANNINLTSTQGAVNATNTQGAFNMTSTVSGNSFTSTAFAATVNADATKSQGTQNAAATNTQVFVNQTSTASSLTSTAAAQPRVSVSAASSVSEGSYLAVTFNLTTAMTTTTTINATLSGGNGAQVGGSTSGAVTTGLTDTNCIADAVLQSQPVTTTATTSMSFSVQINTGSTSTTIQVPICTDTATDSTDTLQFVVNSVSPSNVLIGTPSSATVNITDVAQPSIGFNPVSYSVAENVSGGKVTLTVKANNGNVSSNTAVNFTLNNVSATSGLNTCPVGVDYYAITTSPATILSGSDNVTIDVGICYDADNTEGTETFQATITSVGGGYNIGSNPATVSILNAAPPTVNLSAGTYSVNESAGVVGITVQVSPTLAAPATISYSTSAGSATAGTDYSATCTGTSTLPITTSGGSCATANSITLPALTSSVTFYLPINDDGVTESSETFSITLTGVVGGGSPTPAIGSTGTAVITINDTAQPTISVGNTSVTEANAGTTPITMTTTLSRAYVSYAGGIFAGTGLTASATYTINTTTSTALTTGCVGTNCADYTATMTGSVSVPAGSTTNTSTIVITVNGDTIYEPDDKVDVNLSAPTNATLGTSTASFTITNDDAIPTITVGAPTTSITEPALGGSTAIGDFTFTLSNPSQAAISINYSTSNGTATAGYDYSATTNTLTIPAYTTAATTLTSVTHTVTVLGDSIDENNTETFTFNFSVASGSVATLAVGSTSTTITINVQNAASTAPQAYIGTPGSNLPKSATTNITITLTKDSGKTITVNYSWQSGSGLPCSGTAAVSGTDFNAGSGTITFSPAYPSGATSATIPITTQNVTSIKCVLLVLNNPVNLNATEFISFDTDPPTTVGAGGDTLTKAFYIQP